MISIARCVAFGLFAVLLVGCPDGEQPAPNPVDKVSDIESVIPLPAADSPPLFEELPVRLSVGQRTTTPIPGTNNRYLLTIDDVTREQVMVSITDRDGGPALGPTSLAEHQTIPLSLSGQKFQLTLTKLANSLLGDDAAEFEIAQPEEAGSPESKVTPEPLTEAQKIDALIAAVGAQDAVFIRNGTEYTAQEAADHLQMKRDRAGENVQTAADFIDKIGSKSSLSGADYQMRFSDGTTRPAGDFLNEKLQAMEQRDS